MKELLKKRPALVDWADFVREGHRQGDAWEEIRVFYYAVPEESDSQELLRTSWEYPEPPDLVAARNLSGMWWYVIAHASDDDYAGMSGALAVAFATKKDADTWSKFLKKGNGRKKSQRKNRRLSSRERDALPDSAFMAFPYTGKRSLPVYVIGADGKPELSISHINNALARLDQTEDLNATEEAKIRRKLQALQRKYYKQKGEPCPETTSGCPVPNPRGRVMIKNSRLPKRRNSRGVAMRVKAPHILKANPHAPLRWHGGPFTRGGPTRVPGYEPTRVYRARSQHKSEDGNTPVYLVVRVTSRKYRQFPWCLYASHNKRTTWSYLGCFGKKAAAQRAANSLRP